MECNKAVFNAKKLASAALAGSALGAVVMEGCIIKKPSVEYSEGSVVVAADPMQRTEKVRKITREQVLAGLGVRSEGKQVDGSYVICMDMSLVYVCPEGQENSGSACMSQQDRMRIAARFEPVLLDQASSLLLAENCSRFYSVKREMNCGTGSGFAVPANCVMQERGVVQQVEGTIKGLGMSRTGVDGDFVCLWTTPPAEIDCK